MMSDERPKGLMWSPQEIAADLTRLGLKTTEAEVVEWCESGEVRARVYTLVRVMPSEYARLRKRLLGE